MERREIPTGTEKLLCHVEGGVAVVTFNDPARKNPIGSPIRPLLLRVIERLADDPAVRCVLLTGAGKAFCAGGDAAAMGRRADDAPLEARTAQLRADQVTAALLHEMPKPTLAALPGAAAGAGLALALACDLRIAAESAFVTTAFARLGLSGDFGCSWLLTQVVGPAVARELFFSAERVDAARCAQLGIVQRVVPDERLLPEALELAHRLAAGPTLAYGRMKENLNFALRAPLRECLDREVEATCLLAESEDHKEAARAFLEKRPPTFQGR